MALPTRFPPPPAQAELADRPVTRPVRVRPGTGFGKRAVDVALSATLLALISPLMVIVLLIKLGRGRAVMRTRLVGRYGVPFHRYGFRPTTGWPAPLASRFGVDSWPALFNVLGGSLSFVGPRAFREDEVGDSDPLVEARWQARPGLVSTWWLKERGGIGFDAERESDEQYVATASCRGDLGILARACLVSLYGSTRREAPGVLRILGIRVDNWSMEQAIDGIVERIEAHRESDLDEPCQISFLNAHCANVACRDADYRRALDESELVFADGIGVKIAARMRQQEVKQNVNGTDLFPLLCEALAGSGHGLYLLGARDGVANDVAEWVRKNHPQTRICGTRHGFVSPDDEDDVVREIRDSEAGVLLVAMGVPRQELWIRRHREALDVPVQLGVGGLFDFYSGRIPRAPMWMREIGMEWVYRLWREPGRMWKRYLVGNAVFLARALWDKRRKGTDTEGETSHESSRRRDRVHG